MQQKRQMRQDAKCDLCGTDRADWRHIYVCGHGAKACTSFARAARTLVDDALKANTKKLCELPEQSSRQMKEALDTLTLEEAVSGLWMLHRVQSIDSSMMKPAVRIAQWLVCRGFAMYSGWIKECGKKASLRGATRK